jgi:flavodoxin
MSTQKIGNSIAGKINAKVIELNNNDQPNELEAYELIGFGAGIDSGKHYPQILKFAEKLPNVNNKKAFIFSTSGIYTNKKMLKDHKALRTILERKGFKIIGEFGCKGFNTNSVLKYLGGMNKGRPNDEDIKNAEKFGENLIKGYS